MAAGWWAGVLPGFVGEWQADEEGERDHCGLQEPEGGADGECGQGAGFWCGAVIHEAEKIKNMAITRPIGERKSMSRYVPARAGESATTPRAFKIF